MSPVEGRCPTCGVKWNANKGWETKDGKQEMIEVKIPRLEQSSSDALHILAACVSTLEKSNDRNELMNLRSAIKGLGFMADQALERIHRNISTETMGGQNDDTIS